MSATPKPKGRRKRRVGWLVGVTVIIAVIAACSWGLKEWAVGALVSAPNRGIEPPPGVAPPGARLLRITREGATIEAFVFEATADRSGEPVGTAVILHGLRDQKSSFVGTAERFASHGYRAVIVDLRGHGHSSGDYLSYGLLDGDDVGAILDELETDDELGPVVVVGPSYGGAVALRVAAQDPRVRAVATLATFASLRSILPNHAHLLAPALPSPPDWFIDWALNDAEERTGLDYGLCDSTAAVRAIRVPILFVHGEDDIHIPIANAEALYAACWPDQCHLERALGEDHISILSNEASWALVLEFFDETLARR